MAGNKGEILSSKYGDLKGARFAFNGMNFMIDPADLPIESGQCVDLYNCDVDNQGNASRRNGFTRILDANISSSWSNGTSVFCVSSNLICEVVFIEMGAFLSVLTNSPFATEDIEFKQVNDIVAFSDGSTIGIIQNGVVTVLGGSYFSI